MTKGTLPLQITGLAGQPELLTEGLKMPSTFECGGL